MTNETTTEPRTMMSFGTAIKTCFCKYANFKGRATRAEFWWFNLLIMLVGSGISIIWGTDSDLLWEQLDYGEGISVLSFYPDRDLESLWYLVTLLPRLAVGARRLHDIGRSGWWQLLLLTGIGLIPLIIMWCLRTKPEVNQYDSSK